MTNRGADFDGEHRLSDPQAPSDPAGAFGGPDLGAACARAYADACTRANDDAEELARDYSITMTRGGIYSVPMHSSLLPPQPEIPDAGIRAGEIVGYRAWRVKRPDLLTSMIMEHYEWAPEQVHRSKGVYRGDGFFAFNDPELALREFSSSWESSSLMPTVYGTVAMWGEVVEHERGWRSEYAVINSFDQISGGIFKWHALRRLRKTFGVK